ncbi:hypothetical protein B0J13DRAFT_621286 [Dactylonectria estremocensis]|uniref:Cyclopropane-fatty-acyl-phospholipid synthase n=1 Tax=Dactylonectria estremocensis TaxID=1079267 RepID=A0A9P9F0D5_9HYPO|nr:hypothetical protein B0J13DRAFT_621286 [Dactylonectria estremocensis]
MDGLSKDSLLLPVVLVGDYLGRLPERQPLSPRLACLVFVLLGYYTLLGCVTDLYMVVSLLAWQHASVFTSHIPEANLQQIGLHPGLLAGLTIATLTVGYQIRRLILTNSEATWDGHGSPYLIPSRTSHTRFFPKKHSFSYSYLVVGIPVGFSGSAHGIISADVPEKSTSWFSYMFGRKAWFDVDPADYLLRGRAELDLRGKLDDYLHSQNVDSSRYPHAYLVTAARFLGYHFNPVSFWFLYSQERILSAIVLEVNNTFGERRPYLVERDFAAEAKHIRDLTALAQGGEEVRSRIKGAWKKDFHVSPFNSRQGSYSLLASDPLGTDMEGFLGIDVTINLVSSKGHPKLVARLFSEGEALKPSTLSVVQKTKFLASWFWVGFVTFPRIVKEAARLFFERKLHVWYRPEPLKESMARVADNTEKQLEEVFRSYLHYLISQSPNPIVVKYVPSGIPGPAEEIFSSPSSITEPKTAESVEIKILTPVFYSRFVHYAHDFEAMFSELAESQTVWVDRPELLPKVFLKKAAPPLQASCLKDYLCFQLIKNLRRRPERIARPLISAAAASPTTHTTTDIRGFRISSMDAFVLGQDNAQLKRGYRSAVTQLFIADHVAFGMVELLGLMKFIGRAGVSWLLASLINQAIKNGS